MNIDEFTQRALARLGSRPEDSGSLVYRFLLAVRADMRAEAQHWQRGLEQHQVLAAKALKEGWGETSVQFHREQVREWQRYFDIGAELETLTPENADALLDVVLLGVSEHWGQVGIHYHIALNQLHLYDTPSGQYEDYRSRPVSIINQRLNFIQNLPTVIEVLQDVLPPGNPQREQLEALLRGEA